jgi:hypothetical protein
VESYNPDRVCPRRKVMIAQAPLGEQLVASNDPPEKVDEVAEVPLGAPPRADGEEVRESVAVAPLGPLITVSQKMTEVREENPAPEGFEEHLEPSTSSAVPAKTKPLTEVSLIEKDMLSTIAQIELQLRDEPDLQLCDLDTVGFYGSGSMGTSADMLSDIYSVYTEPRRCAECPVRSS